MFTTKFNKLEEGGVLLPMLSANMTKKNGKKKKKDDLDQNDENVDQTMDENQFSGNEKNRTWNSTSSIKLDSDDDSSTDEEKKRKTKEKLPKLQADTDATKHELYKPTDKQPFFVNAVAKQGEMDAFDLGKTIKLFKIEKVESIKIISKNKARITLNDWKNANKLIKLNSFDAMKNYELIIPSSYVHSEGIVRDIPTYLTIDEIRANTRSSAQITDVYRLNYWNFASRLLFVHREPLKKFLFIMSLRK